MRIRKANSKIAEGDMTPMIDMTFQLIAFFMVLVNFTEADQDDRVKLPMSELAKPPDGPLETPIFLQLTRDGNVGIGGDRVPISKLQPYLIAEAESLRLTKRTPSDATVIIRGDAAVQTGVVQQLIQSCQKAGFDHFALRAKEDVGN
jgi:biopolymer transport protein ExbD